MSEIQEIAVDSGGAAEEDQSDQNKELQLERALRKISDKIHSSSLDEILTELQQDISELLESERITIYVVDRGNNEIYSKVTDGEEIREFRVPISNESIAGFVANNREYVKISDAYDDVELQQIHPDLSFDQSWDEKTGFRTREVLAWPIEKGEILHGVIQVVNKENGEAFTDQDVQILEELSESLAIAFENQKRIRAQRSRWDLLFKENLLEPEQIDEAKEISRKEDMSVEKALVTEFDIDQEKVGESLSDYYGIPYIPFDLDRHIPEHIVETLDLNLLKYNHWVPVEEKEDENTIVVAIENPKDIQVRDDIESWYSGRVEYGVSIREEIINYIDFFFGEGDLEDTEMDDSFDDILGDLAEEDPTAVAEEEEEEEEEFDKDDSAIVRLVNQIIVQGHKQGASDIHFEPQPDDDMLIRFRIDGICQDYRTVPQSYSAAILSRIKIMADLDIAERRLPQDGKIKFRNYGPLDIELRVATVPTSGGVEDAVLRILAGSNMMSISDVGMREAVYQEYIETIDNPYGIVLCVGPTGSGKTTTLHASLSYISDETIKIWTAEDPVEITQKDLRQVQMKPDIGLDFSRAMKAFLRGDPDVIMVGEMRDYETTSTAVEASLTGHMVFSTLHTNSAPETVTRLLDLGIDPYSFGDALRGVMAQRLVRTFCDHCSQEKEITDQEWEKIRGVFGNDDLFEEYGPSREEAILKEASGCQECGQTGYSGRMAIHEFLTTSERIRSLIYEEAEAKEIKQAAHEEGMLTLRQDGIIKMLDGVTDFSEIERVTAG